MINCFVDPIFLTIKNGFDYYTYSEEIFLQFCEFLDKIEGLEKEFGVRFIKFNLNQYFLDECIQRNPFKAKDLRIHFESYITKTFRIYINPKCEDKYIYTPIEIPKYLYENKDVPELMVKYWNSFINQCSNCERCKKENIDLLTSEKYGTRKKDNFEDYFTRFYSDIINWFSQNIASLELLDAYPSENDELIKKVRKLRFILNLKVFLKMRGQIVNQEFVILDDFWNSEFLYAKDLKYKSQLIEVMSDIIIKPENDIHRMHNIRNQNIEIEGHKRTIVQYDVFQEYRLNGLDITPRLLVAFYERKIYFYKIINRH